MLPFAPVLVMEFVHLRSQAGGYGAEVFVYGDQALFRRAETVEDRNALGTFSTRAIGRYSIACSRIPCSTTD